MASLRDRKWIKSSILLRLDRRDASIPTPPSSLSPPLPLVPVSTLESIVILIPFRRISRHSPPYHIFFLLLQTLIFTPNPTSPRTPTVPTSTPSRLANARVRQGKDRNITRKDEIRAPANRIRRRGAVAAAADGGGGGGGGVIFCIISSLLLPSSLYPSFLCDDGNKVTVLGTHTAVSRPTPARL